MTPFFLEDLFGDNIDAGYKKLAKVAHPDAGGDPDNFVALTRMKSLASRRQEAGVYGQRLVPGEERILKLVSPKGDIDIVERLAKGSVTSVYYRFDKPGNVVRTALTPTCNDLVQNASANLRRLAASGIDKSLLSFFPRVVDEWTVKQDKRHFRCLELHYPSGQSVDLFTLSLLVKTKDREKHALWILRRGLLALASMAKAGVKHNNLTPRHIVVHPKQHHVTFCGWGGSSLTGEKAKYLPATSEFTVSPLANLPTMVRQQPKDFFDVRTLYWSTLWFGIENQKIKEHLAKQAPQAVTAEQIFDLYESLGKIIEKELGRRYSELTI